MVTGVFLKPRIKGLVGLSAFWLLLWFLQSEYLNYVNYSGDSQFVLHSSLLKVGLILLSLLIYALIIERPIYIIKKKITKTTLSTKHTSTMPQDDGFDFIREKKDLKNKSDQLLDK